MAGSARSRRWLVGGLVAVALVAGLALAARTMRFAYAPMPSEAALLNPERLPLPAYDVFGRSIDADEAERLGTSGEGRRLLAARNGAVRVDAKLWREGREAFWRETFANEVFLTDVLGLLDGAISPWAMARAVMGATFAGTGNLEVRLARDKQVGDRLYRRGEVIRTGLDLPRGGLVPLGIKVAWDRGHLRVGITCAACHAAVDPATGRIVEGAPNTDLDTGLVMALAANSAAYFTHTSMPTLEPFLNPRSPRVVDSTGAVQRLPEPQPFETAVAGMLDAWPPGSFDPTLDLVNNPTQIPDSFTFGDHPYGWSGFAGAGPFRGLSMLSNNVHGLNADATNEAAGAPDLFGLDTEVYLGTLLQRAPAARLRYAQRGGRKPSEILAAADPTRGSPGLNQAVVLPTWPRASFMSSNGLVASVPGRPVARGLDAMSAFQNTLLPPSAEPAQAAGQAIFERAGCVRCHGGPAYTANRVLPVAEIGTQPSRAAALAGAAKDFQRPVFFPPSVTAPAIGSVTLVQVPVSPELEAQLRLGWAQDPQRAGGYKTKGLIGLAWSAPYLHDGGVAVGADPSRLGLPGTVLAGERPDPANSLRALLDRGLRALVVAANRDAGLEDAVQVAGTGHAFWVDAGAGFSTADQDALVAWLLAIDRPAP